MSWDMNEIATLVLGVEGGRADAQETLVDRVVADARSRGAASVSFSLESNHGSVRYLKPDWDQPRERMRMPVEAQRTLVGWLVGSGRAVADGDGARLQL